MEGKLQFHSCMKRWNRFWFLTGFNSTCPFEKMTPWYLYRSSFSLIIDNTVLLDSFWIAVANFMYNSTLDLDIMLQKLTVQISSIHSVMSNSLQLHGLEHARLPCPTVTPRTCSNSWSLSWWCHPTISSSAVPFSSCLQSFPASGSFPVSQFFTSGGQSIGASALASVFPMKIQDWFPLRWTGWLSLQSKGLSKAFTNTTVQKHWKLSLWSNSHIHIWLLEKQ